MQPRALVPTYELFFILESFQACFAEYVTALRPLEGKVEDGLLGCDAYYREDTDVALLSLRFDERSLDAERLSWILDFAGGAGLAALDPTMLPDDDRRRFYKNYLEEYPLRTEDREHPQDALQSLAETLGLRVPRPRALTSKVVRTPPPGRRNRPTMPAHNRMRTDATKTWKPTGRGRPGPPPQPRAVGTDPPSEPNIEAAPDPVAEQPTAPKERRAGQPPRRYPRASSPAPIARVRLGSDSDSKKQPAQKPRRPRPVTRRPPGVTSSAKHKSSDGDSPEKISVRFRRGDEWVPARLRSLGLKGAYLACGAPPRLHDDVHVALGLGPFGTVMRGTVVHVTDAADAVESGASGFGVLFPPIDSPSRRQLKELLQQARKLGIVLEPPPPRTAVRFPVRWPVHIILPNQLGLDLAALDVSNHGMFVSTLDRLPAGALEFFMPTERGGTPIQGRVRAVREVPWKMACARGLHSGFGMEIVDFTRADDNRYADFINRVGRRVQRRVLIGASSDRTEELVSGLMAAGYTVTGTSDPNAIIKIAECEPRPPDAALLDGSLMLQPETAHRIERLFAMRDVPMVNIAGEPAYRARAVVDGLLAVNAIPR